MGGHITSSTAKQQEEEQHKVFKSRGKKTAKKTVVMEVENNKNMNEKLYYQLNNKNNNHNNEIDSNIKEKGENIYTENNSNSKSDSSNHNNKNRNTLPQQQRIIRGKKTSRKTAPKWKKNNSISHDLFLPNTMLMTIHNQENSSTDNNNNNNNSKNERTSSSLETMAAATLPVTTPVTTPPPTPKTGGGGTTSLSSHNPSCYISGRPTRMAKEMANFFMDSRNLLTPTKRSYTPPCRSSNSSNSSSNSHNNNKRQKKTETAAAKTGKILDLIEETETAEAAVAVAAVVTPSAKENSWEKCFQKLKVYYETHSPQTIPRIPPLDKWIYEQRHRYKNTMNKKKSRVLTEEQLKQLESIGFLWLSSPKPTKKRSASATPGVAESSSNKKRKKETSTAATAKVSDEKSKRDTSSDAAVMASKKETSTAAAAMASNKSSEKETYAVATASIKKSKSESSAVVAATASDESSKKETLVVAAAMESKESSKKETSAVVAATASNKSNKETSAVAAAKASNKSSKKETSAAGTASNKKSKIKTTPVAAGTASSKSNEKETAAVTAGIAINKKSKRETSSAADDTTSRRKETSAVTATNANNKKSNRETSVVADAMVSNKSSRKETSAAAAMASSNSSEKKTSSAVMRNSRKNETSPSTTASNNNDNMKETPVHAVTRNEILARKNKNETPDAGKALAIARTMMSAWDSKFEELKSWYEFNWNNPRVEATGPLGSWAKDQRNRYKNKKSRKNLNRSITDQHVQQLDSIEFIWDIENNIDNSNNNTISPLDSTTGKSKKKKKTSNTVAAVPATTISSTIIAMSSPPISKKDKLKKDIKSILLSFGSDTELGNSMKAIRKLWKILDSQSNDLKTYASNEIIALHGLMVMISSLMKHRDCREFTHFTIDCLVVITSYEAESKAKQFLTRVFDILLDAVEKYPTVADIKGSFVGLLHNISTACDSIGEIVADELLVDYVIAVMKDQVNDWYTNERGCHYFCEIMKLGGKELNMLKRKGVATILSSTVSNNNFDHPLQELAQDALDNLFQKTPTIGKGT